MLDRRKNFRGRVYYGARIAFNERRSTMDGIIRDFSERGACVDAEHLPRLLEECDLTVDSKGIAFRARMVWQRGRRAGFAFSDPRHLPVPMTLDWALRLRAAERTNKALLQRMTQLLGSAI
jgi:hypothetical protein